MDRPRLNQQAVTWSWFELMKEFRASPVADGGGKLFRSNSGLESRVDLAPRLGLEHHPRLGLPQIGRGEPCGLGIVGVNLNAKGQLGIEELEQQRKPRLGMMPP